MVRLLACALALLSPSALAAGFTVETPAGIDLAAGAESPYDSADVQLSQGVLKAALGARVEGRDGPALPMVPIEVGAAYLVPSAKGQIFRLTVLCSLGSKLVVEVTRAEDPAEHNALLRGRYRLTYISMDGQRADSALPDLEFNDDGSYRLGGATAAFEQLPRVVGLEGYYRTWGPAEIADRGETLIFRFHRGAVEVEAVYSRAPTSEAIARN